MTESVNEEPIEYNVDIEDIIAPIDDPKALERKAERERKASEQKEKKLAREIQKASDNSSDAQEEINTAGKAVIKWYVIFALSVGYQAGNWWYDQQWYWFALGIVLMVVSLVNINDRNTEKDKAQKKLKAAERRYRNLNLGIEE